MAVFITVSLAVVLALLVARAVRFWRRFRAFRALANRIPGPETAWIVSVALLDVSPRIENSIYTRAHQL